MPECPFFAVVAADFEDMSDSAQIELAKRLVNGGAMWVAATGKSCSDFDDLVDHVCVEKDLDSRSEGPLVMTTWHEDESLDDILEFLEVVTPSDDWGVEVWDTLVIEVSC
ncbi:DUF7684 family protein [Kordiimonas marina]|uniref:DUF7684 family protein n=1 Tax=Kordiimonas marina TaxID=2872312 RepID=UPI001FF6AE7C|nr:hypothetical protein [Kordiimonas marina]MCJ9428716.1 hypothetical protein [Kordiimonas marina]